MIKRPSLVSSDFGRMGPCSVKYVQILNSQAFGFPHNSIFRHSVFRLSLKVNIREVGREGQTFVTEFVDFFFFFFFF